MIDLTEGNGQKSSLGAFALKVFFLAFLFIFCLSFLFLILFLVWFLFMHVCLGYYIVLSKF